MADEDFETFDAVKARLDAIVEAVSDDALPLDDALALYEEAVALGLRASDLLESDIDIAQERAALEASAAETPLAPPADEIAARAASATTEADATAATAEADATTATDATTEADATAATAATTGSALDVSGGIHG